MPTPLAHRVMSDPILNPGDQDWFDAAGRGELALRQCLDCNQMHHFPRAFCPFCWSQNLTWLRASGRGTIYSFTITRKGADTPYCLAYVALAEGPLMLTNIVEADGDALAIGQEVELCFSESRNGTKIPVFRPKGGEQL